MKQKKSILVLILIFSILIPFVQIHGVQAVENNYLDELQTYRFDLEGKSYQLPVKVSEFEKNGWKLKLDDYNETTWSLSIIYTYMIKGDKTIRVGVMNPYADSSKDYSNFIVFSIKSSDLITLPGNIKSGSTRDEVRKAYGAPFHKNNSRKPEGTTTIEDANYYMEYIESDYDEVQFDHIYTSGVTIYSDKNSKVTSIDMEYLNLDLEALYSKNTPSVQYEDPISIGKSILSFHIQLEDDLYRIPAPFTSFLDNGWEIAGICDPNTNKLLTTTIPKYLFIDSSEYIRLVKNGHYLYVRVANEDTSVQKLENCTVTTVSFTNNKTPKFILPNNMSSLSTVSKLLSNYNNDTYIKNKTKTKIYYNYYDYRTKEYSNKYHQHSDGYYTGRVRFKASNGKITQITMEHTTKDYLGNIQVSVKEKPAKIVSEQDAKDYFCYSNFGTGTWQSSIGYVIQFGKDNTINAYDAGAGNPWFLKSGDSVDAVATYSFDTSNNMIIIHDYDRDIKIKYDVINSERVYITVNGYTQEFTTGHVTVSEYGIAKVPENISIKKGSSKTLVPVLPAGVTYKVSYKTSNKNISTISSNGKIIGKKRGSCTITTYVKIGTITTNYKTLVKVN